MLLNLCILPTALAVVSPIIISGKHFVDSLTKEPFYIRGVDYQPGGSSAATTEGTDPLSDPKTCARDIALFQKLDINTIRVYNIDHKLNHDICMTLLAEAGIYLVLDVNSPLQGRHLNRYEPWSTYNKDYLANIFSVVQQFSTYNNTLAYFAGNEIVNDETSASKAPVYIKAVIRDIKQYIRTNSPRIIPVGYSAADDLKFRISLSEYLECANKDTSEGVDFYGVNSYQWCGEQTFYTSGYSSLVQAYASFSKPVFFSEYGCNIVTPRKFDEIRSIYSDDMAHVFSGGLIYEFTEEPNQYGLVKILPGKDVQLLPDFHQARLRLAQVAKEKLKGKPGKLKRAHDPPKCKEEYPNLSITRTLPPTVGHDLIHKGVRVQNGKYVKLSEAAYKSPYQVYDVDGKKIYLESPKVTAVSSIFAEWQKQSNGMYYSSFGMGSDDMDEEYDSESDSSYSAEELEGSEASKFALLSGVLNRINRAFRRLFDANES